MVIIQEIYDDVGDDAHIVPKNYDKYLIKP